MFPHGRKKKEKSLKARVIPVYFMGRDRPVANIRSGVCFLGDFLRDGQS